jgi:hypothetical protein
VPEKVPLWVVQNTFATFGNRMPPMGDTLPKDMKVCATCLRELYKPIDWNWCRDRYFCNACIKDARKEEEKEWEEEAQERRRSYGDDGHGYGRETYLRGLPHSRGEFQIIPRVDSGVRAVPRSEAEVPLGNLEESEYQYWIGCLEVTLPSNIISARATCRACGCVTHGRLGREQHKIESQQFYTQKFSCMKVIADAIRTLVTHHNCFVCKNYTLKKHYGVPICSPNCHKLWRFAEHMDYPELDQAITPYWMSTTTIETGGSSTSESSSNQTQTASSTAQQE